MVVESDKAGRLIGKFVVANEEEVKNKYGTFRGSRDGGSASLYPTGEWYVLQPTDGLDDLSMRGKTPTYGVHVGGIEQIELSNWVGTRLTLTAQVKPRAKLVVV